MADMPFGFDTLQIHAGAKPDPSTGARQVPIYQNTAYVFRDADHAAALFNLQEVGYIYSRLTNPTVMALAERLAVLEGGVGAVCTSSGHAAQLMALFPLMLPGDNIISSNRLYGGTVTQFSHTIRRFGWSARFADTDDLGCAGGAGGRADAGDLLRVDRQSGRVCYGYSCGCGGGEAARGAADRRQHLGDPIPLPADRAGRGHRGAFDHQVPDRQRHGGRRLRDRLGQFDWSAAGKFPSLSEPEEAYHGLRFHETFGPMAYTFFGIAIGLRDLGMTMAPQNAFLTLLGTETLSLRMKKHVENAEKVAAWLESDPRVEAVTYAGLPSSPWHERAKRLYPNGAGALFTFALKGGYDACVRLVNSVELFSHVANLGDARSLIIHSASTTHRQLTPEQLVAAGAAPNMVRLSIGIEDPADIIRDLDQALAKAVA